MYVRQSSNCHHGEQSTWTNLNVVFDSASSGDSAVRLLGQTLALQLISSVTLGKLPNISVLCFFHLQMGMMIVSTLREIAMKNK